MVAVYLVHFQLDQKWGQVDCGRSLCCLMAGQEDRDLHLPSAGSGASPWAANELEDTNVRGLLPPKQDLYQSLTVCMFLEASAKLSLATKLVFQILEEGTCVAPQSSAEIQD